MKILDKNTFSEIEKCTCGKDVFKYHNTSRNVFVAKCSNYTHEFGRDLKWTETKKQPCGFHCVYYGERPVILENIKKVIVKKSETVSLEERLRLLFNFVVVSNHSSTLDEINIIVRNKLKREPRKTFYLVSTTKVMPISHYESLEDYRDRIFSKKIVDLEFVENKENFKPVYFIDKSYLPQAPQKTKNPKPKIIKKKKPILQESSQFIIVSGDENDSSEDNVTETESNYSDSEKSDSTKTDEDRENSDYDDVYEEVYEEVYDDYYDDNYDDEN